MKASNTNKISGYVWRYDVTLQELMTFMGIMILSTLDPTPGRDIQYIFQHPSKYPYTKKMKFYRFRQIKSSLHCSNNEVEKKSQDYLFKVRPLLNTLKATLGKYLNAGDEFALDESSCPCRSKYGRALIFYNPSKPTGKYHFRFYLCCCSSTYCILRLRVHTRNTSDLADGYNKNATSKSTCAEEQNDTVSADDDDDDDDRNDISEENENHNSKTTNLILDMTKPFFGSGRTMTMDNYYGGAEALVKLKENGVLARCTYRQNRKHSCPFVRMTKKDSQPYKRGSYKVAANRQHGIVAYGWLDGNPVHLMSTADGTGQTYVKRQVHSSKQLVNAPIGIKRYNNAMQAVDRTDQIMRLFALVQRYHSKKWYKQMFFALVDFGTTNANQHFFCGIQKRNSTVITDLYIWRTLAMI